MPDLPRPTIAIVGGGFCGAATALHLLRDHPGLHADIVVIEPRERLGAGLAYGTTDPEHRVNVAADRMSPFPEQPAHFDAWLRTHADPDTDPAGALPDGRLFPRRRTYGRYIDEILGQAAAASTGPTLRHLRDCAVAASDQASRIEITLAGTHSTEACTHTDARPETAPGSDISKLPEAPPVRTDVVPGSDVPHDFGTVPCPGTIPHSGTVLGFNTVVHADALVLAVGHPAPDLPAALAALSGHPGLVADPWDTSRLDAIAHDAAVLVVGTGLTACDVVASLRARGHTGPITMVSRRGLLPRSRTTLPVAPFGDFVAHSETTALGLLRRIRHAVAEAGAQGRPWEDIVAALREQARPVWGALPIPQRARLLRHLRPFWDVHRFQCAPQIDHLLREEQRQGRVHVRAATPVASVVSATPETDAVLPVADAILPETGVVLPAAATMPPEADAIPPAATLPRGGSLEITLRPRGSTATETHRFGAVVSCVGPGHRSVVSSNPLLHSLDQAGTLSADALRLGIAVDRDSRVLGHDGAPNSRLFVAGPLARGQHGELMGLPQVSTQPREVAASLARLLGRREAAPKPCDPETPPLRHHRNPPDPAPTGTRG